MFHFGGFPSLHYFIHAMIPSSSLAVVSQFGDLRIDRLFTAPRSLSQLVTSFFGSRCQGIHLMLFFAWTSPVWMIIHSCAFLANNSFRLFLLLISPFVQNVVFLPTFRKDLLLSCKKVSKELLLLSVRGLPLTLSKFWSLCYFSLLSKITLVFSQLSVSFSFFIRFSMNISKE